MWLLKSEQESQNMEAAATSLTLLCLCSVGLCGTAGATPIQVRRTFLTTFCVRVVGLGFSILIFWKAAMKAVSDGVKDPETLTNPLVCVKTDRTGASESEFFIKNSWFLSQTSLPELRKARGDVPDPHPDPNAESELASPVSDFENSYNYVCECPRSVQSQFAWK